jgi:anhydro-N-acetylmuramic acid kinase
LGREWFHESFLSILNAFDIPTEDKLRTVTQHIAIQMKNSIPTNDGNILLSGGGALNKFLVNTIKKQLSNPVVIPCETIIHYKEALIFAFLAVLVEKNMVNCLASVTGASKDTCCGAYYRA